ncbi:ATP-binding protein [Spirochaetota bacterium]
MQVAIASGKGGTGKTTISTAMAGYIGGRGLPVRVIDCDVEEPNVNLFLKTDIEKKIPVHTLVPSVDDDKCNGCEQCSTICQFSAIVMVKDKPLVFPDMCHSCGGCFLACPREAITEIRKEIGFIEKGNINNIKYIGGRLNIKEAMSPPLIKAVKEDIDNNMINIIDSPPGTSCPVIESIKGSDYVALVTEPTPFGLNDLELAVNMVREIALPFGVIINRADIGDSRVNDYCKKENIDIIASIPDSKKVAKGYSKGELIEVFINEFQDELGKILLKL